MDCVHYIFGDVKEVGEDNELFPYLVFPDWELTLDDLEDKLFLKKKAFIEEKLKQENIALQTRDSYYIGWLQLNPDEFLQMEVFLKTKLKDCLKLQCKTDIFSDVSIDEFVDSYMSMKLDKSLFAKCKAELPKRIPYARHDTSKSDVIALSHIYDIKYDIIMEEQNIVNPYPMLCTVLDELCKISDKYVFEHHPTFAFAFVSREKN